MSPFPISSPAGAGWCSIACARSPSSAASRRPRPALSPLRSTLPRPAKGRGSLRAESLLQERRVLHRRVLAGDGIGDRRLEALRALPFRARPRSSLAADLIDAPINFEAMAVGIAE